MILPLRPGMKSPPEHLWQDDGLRTPAERWRELRERASLRREDGRNVRREARVLELAEDAAGAGEGARRAGHDGLPDFQIRDREGRVRDVRDGDGWLVSALRVSRDERLLEHVRDHTLLELRGHHRELP